MIDRDSLLISGLELAKKKDDGSESKTKLAAKYASLGLLGAGDVAQKVSSATGEQTPATTLLTSTDLSKIIDQMKKEKGKFYG